MASNYIVNTVNKILDTIVEAIICILVVMSKILLGSAIYLYTYIYNNW